MIRAGDSERFSLAPPLPTFAPVTALQEERPAPGAPDDACAIIVFGPSLPNAPNEIQLMRNYLKNNDLVNSNNVFLDSDSQGNLKPSTRADLQSLLDQAKAVGCTKYYITVFAHGSPQAWGKPGFSLEGGTLPYEDYVEMLKALGAERLCLIQSSCYSGQLHFWIQGQGLNGTLLTPADSEHMSWGASGGAFVIQELFAVADDYDTLDEALDHVLETTQNEYILMQHPMSMEIDPEGTRRIHAPYVTIAAPSLRQVVRIDPPASVNLGATFTGSVRLLQDGVARTVVDAFTMEPGSTHSFITFEGLDCGEARYALDPVQLGRAGRATGIVGDRRIRERFSAQARRVAGCWPLTRLPEDGRIGLRAAMRGTVPEELDRSPSAAAVFPRPSASRLRDGGLEAHRQRHPAVFRRWRRNLGPRQRSRRGG